jgi:hypothetical protein
LVRAKVVAKKRSRFGLSLPLAFRPWEVIQ